MGAAAELPAPTEAVALLDRMWELVQQQWRLHFLVVIPAQIAAEIFNDRYLELYGADDPLAPYRLLRSPRFETELVSLARRATELRVDDLIRDLYVVHTLERLSELAPGRVWLRELR